MVWFCNTQLRLLLQQHCIDSFCISRLADCIVRTVISISMSQDFSMSQSLPLVFLQFLPSSGSLGSVKSDHFKLKNNIIKKMELTNSSNSLACCHLQLKDEV